MKCVLQIAAFVGALAWTSFAFAIEPSPAPVAGPPAPTAKGLLYGAELRRVEGDFAGRKGEGIRPVRPDDGSRNRKGGVIAATYKPGTATCDGTPSCQHTCEGNIPTCDSVSCGPGAYTCIGSGPTCSTGPTCWPNPTCFGSATCMGGPTCVVPPVPTCGGGVPTCSYEPSCEGYGCFGARTVPGGPLGGTSQGGALSVLMSLAGGLWFGGRRKV